MDAKKMMEARMQGRKLKANGTAPVAKFREGQEVWLDNHNCTAIVLEVVFNQHVWIHSYKVSPTSGLPETDEKVLEVMEWAVSPHDLAKLAAIATKAVVGKPRSFRNEAIEVARKCEDAYSFDRFTSWTAVAEMLLRRGYDHKQAEAVMRSKWTRWAADASDKKFGKARAYDMKKWLDNSFKTREDEREEVIKLTKETF